MYCVLSTVDYHLVDPIKKYSREVRRPNKNYQIITTMYIGVAVNYTELSNARHANKSHNCSASEKSVPVNVKRLSVKFSTMPCTSTLPCSDEIET